MITYDMLMFTVNVTKQFFTSVTLLSTSDLKQNLPETRIVYSLAYFVLDFSHRVSRNAKTVINENIGHFRDERKPGASPIAQSLARLSLITVPQASA